MSRIAERAQDVRSRLESEGTAVTSIELRTQKQLHQALQQMQQQQTQQQGFVQAWTDLTQSLAQTAGAAVAAITNPARAKSSLGHEWPW